jgi:hypothetical protein
MSLKALWNWIGSKLRKPAEKPEVVEESDNELRKGKNIVLIGLSGGLETKMKNILLLKK